MNQENESNILVEKAKRAKKLAKERSDLRNRNMQEIMTRRSGEMGVNSSRRSVRGPAVPIAVPAADRPLFERKMAEEVLEKTSARSIEPTGDRESGTIEVRGGPLVSIKRPHKNWEHAIAHNFELRSRLGTIKYTDMADLAGNLSLDIGGFGYHSVRARAVPLLPASVIIDFEAPTGVPANQIQPSHPALPAAPIARRRQWECFLEIYYPQNTMVQFSPMFSTETIVRQKAEYWDPAELESIIGTGNPVAGAVLVKDVVGETLKDYLAIEDGRPANTSDLFWISYSERTGKAMVVLIAEGIVGHDPEAPPPVVPSEPVVEPPKPWEPPSPDDSGTTPPLEPELEYTDPVTGLPLVVEPAPAIESLLYVLHDRAISYSENGGSTWKSRPAPGSANLMDICAGPGGIFVLNSENEVWFARYPEVPFVKLALDYFQNEDTGIPVPNGDFETGELAPWVNMGTDPAQVKKTTFPEQTSGSKYYLTRQWNVYNPQPFTVRQTISLPDDRILAGDLTASVDCQILSNGESARLRILLEEEVAVTSEAFTITYSDGIFRATGFATSPTQGPLNLVGTPATVTAPWSVAGGNSIQIGAGINNQAIQGYLNWRVEKSDGSLYEGLVAIRIFDLDNPNGTREKVKITGCADYDLSSSGVSAIETASPGVVDFTGYSTILSPGSPLGAFNVLVRPEFSFHYRGEALAGLGLKGPGAWAPNSFATAESEVIQANAGGWKTIETSVSLSGQKSIVLELSAFSGDEEDLDVDVFFDNVKLNAKNVPTAQVPTALAHDAGKDGGADVYVGNDLVEQRGIGRDMATVPTPDDGITMADSRDDIKVASNGSEAWVRQDGNWTGPYEGPFTSLVADPLIALMRSNGMILTSVGGAFAPASFTEGSTIVGDRYRGGLLLTAPSGNVENLDASGISTEPSVQPINVEAADRRSMAMDAGRLIGWNVGTRDIFWKDQAGSWKLGNATVDGIKKIVEYR